MFTVKDYNFIMTEYRYSGGGFTHDRERFTFSIYMHKDMRLSTIVELHLERLTKPIPRTKDDRVLYAIVHIPKGSKKGDEEDRAEDPDQLRQILDYYKEEGLADGTGL
jgi:hypothetical protein